MSDSDVAASPSGEAHLSIGAVSEIAGIPEATLRVWERRYRFPQSARSPGGHRQYSHQDVLQLRWVKMQMDAGMRASSAISARALLARDSAVHSALREPVPPAGPPDPAAGEARARLLTALLAYDTAQAAALLDQVAMRSSIQSAVLDVVGPALAAIGDAWADGNADVAVEHFATNFLRHHLLKWMRASPAPHPARPVALACAPDELHEGSLLMLGVLLRQLRWPVLYLGQSLPLADLDALVQRAHPALIVFVAMREPSARALAEWPRWLRSRGGFQAPLIGYGGRAFTEHPALAGSVPGTLLGATLHEGSQRINRVMLHLAVLRQ
ncbi:MAG TPA: MerR family transcriptional regulator [Ktedonobacterales bacterium]